MILYIYIYIITMCLTCLYMNFIRLIFFYGKIRTFEKKRGVNNQMVRGKNPVQTQFSNSYPFDNI